MNLADAILHLKPEFAMRLAQIAAIRARYGYLATIPNDIVNIILEFLPDLRQTYTQKQLADAEQKYNKFLAQFNNNRHTYVSPGSDEIPSPIISRQKIKDHLGKKYNSGIIYAKLHNNYLRFTEEYPYIGDTLVRFLKNGQKMICTNIDPTDIVHWTSTNKWTLLPQDQLVTVDKMYKCMWLLPCNLLLIKNSKEYRLSDPITNESVIIQSDIDLPSINDVSVEHPFIKSICLVDDFGKIIDASKIHKFTRCIYHVIHFSDLSPYQISAHLG